MTKKEGDRMQPGPTEFGGSEVIRLPYFVEFFQETVWGYHHQDRPGSGWSSVTRGRVRFKQKNLLNFLEPSTFAAFFVANVMSPLL